MVYAPIIYEKYGKFAVLQSSVVLITVTMSGVSFFTSHISQVPGPMAVGFYHNTVFYTRDNLNGDQSALLIFINSRGSSKKKRSKRPKI